MRWWLAVAAAGAAVLACARPAAASSDWCACEVHWKVENIRRECGGLAILRPGNDSRINLFFLTADRRKGLPPDFGYPQPYRENRSLGHVFTGWNDIRGQFLPVPERDGYRPLYAERGECERLAQVRAEFNAALDANRGLPEAERGKLKQARLDLEAGCHAPPKYEWRGPQPDFTQPPRWPEGISSPAGQAFLGYLQAAWAFHAEDRDAARSQFAALEQAGDPWVAETARFMAIRIELDSTYFMQADEYGAVAEGKYDPASVLRGERAIAAYQAAYPKGRYFADAEDMKRRVFAMRGDWGGLAGALSARIDNGPRDGVATAGLIDEADTYLLGDRKGPEFLRDPEMLAVWDLRAMRIRPKELGNDRVYYMVDENDYGPEPAQLSRQGLQAQAEAFAGYDELYAFLDASFAFYREQDYTRVLALIPPGTRARSYTTLELSRQALRAMALDRLGDPGAPAQWASLLEGASAPYQRQAVELGLALSLERAGRLDEVFAPGSPVTDTTLRSRILQFAASRAMLRRAAADRTRPPRERDMAAFTLLYKDLSLGHYADFAADRALVRPGAPSEGWFYNLATSEDVPAGLFVKGPFARGGFPCPDLAVTARQLAARPDDSRALLCLGEFWRIAGFDVYLPENNQPMADEIGAIKPQFTGQLLERGDIYLKVLANPATTRADRAYALYRSIWCYASSGIQRCGGKEVEPAQRKAWFTELKTRHAKTVWAQRAEVYW